MMDITTAAQTLYLAAVRLRPAPTLGSADRPADHRLVNLNTTMGALRALDAALREVGPTIYASMGEPVEIATMQDGDEVEWIEQACSPPA